MALLEHAGDQDASDALYKIRHSLAHVLAQAVLGMRPGSTLGFGPPIADGFYYDFILDEPLTEEDFPELEKRMKRIIKQGQKFEVEQLPKAEAFAQLDSMGEAYKREYAEELFAKHNLDVLTFYRNGPFLDMCEGPHVDSTRQIPAGCFRIRSLAGAYWRGDSDNVMMTRIYVWAFESKEVLEEHIRRWKDAQARDHKKLGKQLGIYTIDNDVGRGLPLWLPNGTVVRDELEKFIKELEFQDGYQRVSTPHLAKEELYFQTGHLPYYADAMYPQLQVEDRSADAEEGSVRETYRLRPMNCPHHHKIFSAEPRSYRDLPLRLAEYGQCYRWEDSGAVTGLVRVRAMSMNDAHIYCTPEQVKDEIKAVMALYQAAYKVLGITDYFVRLSKWDPDDPKGKDKYVADPAAWAATEQTLQEVLDELDIDHVIGIGEAAFYGPKLDIQFRTVTGRDESVSTVQLDFAVPGRMGLVYKGSDGEEHTPYCIHRAPLSTHERMVAFLLEHFAGAFPTWLAPLQVQVLTVSEHFDDYAKGLVQRLRKQFVRVELAPSSETVSKKIREGTTAKIPNLLVIGEREVAEGTVTLRRYGSREQTTMPVAVFEAALLATIRDRSLAFQMPEADAAEPQG